jgi:hypothetical protein
MSEIEDIDKFIDEGISWAQQNERESLEKVFTRFCLLKAKVPDF